MKPMPNQYDPEKEARDQNAIIQAERAAHGGRLPSEAAMEDTEHLMPTETERPKAPKRIRPSRRRPAREHYICTWETAAGEWEAITVPIMVGWVIARALAKEDRCYDVKLIGASGTATLEADGSGKVRWKNSPSTTFDQRTIVML